MSSAFANRKIAKSIKATAKSDLKRAVAVFGLVAYPSLTQPSEASGKYDTLFIVDPTDPTYADLEALVGDLAEDLCGSRELPPRYHNPLRDGDEKKPDGSWTFKHDAFRGKAVVRLKSAFQPKCYFGPRQTPCDAAEIKGGDECVIEITGFNFNNQSAGVALSLGPVWQINPGSVSIERGGSGGTSFANIDSSRFQFRGAESLHSDDE